MADIFSTEGDIELLAAGERNWMLSDRCVAVLRGYDALFVPTFEWPHKRDVAARLGRPVLDTTDLVATWSDDEVTYRRQAYATLASAWSNFADLRIDGIDISLSLSLCLLPAVERALVYALCLEKLKERGIGKLAILVDPRSSNGGLLHGLLLRLKLFDQGLWLQVNADGIRQLPMPEPFDIGLPPRVMPTRRSPHGIIDGRQRRLVEFTAPRATDEEADGGADDAVLVSSNARFDKAATWLRGSVLGARAAGRGRLSRGNVLICTSSAYALYTRHTRGVVEELIRRDEPFHVLLVPPAKEELFPELPHSALFVKPNLDRVVWSSEDFLPVWEAIKSRSDDLATAQGGIAAFGLAYGAHSHYYMRGVREIMDMAAHLDSVLAELAPRSLWLANARDAGDDLLASIAHKHGVAVITGLPALAVDSVISTPFFSPKVHWTGYGTSLRDIFVNRGMPAEAMTLTGAPHYDHFYRLDKDALRGEFRRQHGLADNARVLAVLTSRADPESEDVWLAELIRWATANGHMIVYKRHPDSARRGYERLEALVASLPGAAFIWATSDAASAICAADICVTDHSTIAIEITIIGRPLVQVRMGRLGNRIADYDAEGIAYGVDDPAGLIAVMARLVVEPRPRTEGRKAFLERFNWGDDGGASGRIADLLLTPPAIPNSGNVPLLQAAW